MGDCQPSVLSAFTANQPPLQAADDLSFFFRATMPAKPAKNTSFYPEYEILIFLYFKWSEVPLSRYEPFAINVLNL